MNRTATTAKSTITIWELKEPTEGHLVVMPNKKVYLITYSKWVNRLMTFLAHLLGTKQEVNL